MKLAALARGEGSGGPPTGRVAGLAVAAAGLTSRPLVTRGAAPLSAESREATQKERLVYSLAFFREIARKGGAPLCHTVPSIVDHMLKIDQHHTPMTYPSPGPSPHVVRTLAVEARVDPATVRRALSGQPTRASLRERIAQVAQRHGIALPVAPSLVSPAESSRG